MGLSKLESLPIDLLLAICSVLRPEDCLRFIQTSKSLHELSALKVFWVHCAMRLEQRRRVHRLPLGQLDISSLRSSILHTLKLDLKWSGTENVDPRPVRVLSLDTTQYQSPAVEGKAVTWAWFIDDGLHIICVVDDVLIQLWHMPSNKPVFVFHAGGRLIRASKYTNHKYFVLAACIAATDTDCSSYTCFRVWRYEWGTPESSPHNGLFIDVKIPVEATFTFINQNLTGLVYVQDDARDDIHAIKGSVNILVINWQDPSKILRCCTPLAIFGREHARQCRDDTFRMTRSSDRLIMHFEATLSVDSYIYEFDMFHTLLVEHATAISEDPRRIEVYPEQRITYTLASGKENGLPTDTPWATWGDSSLWDGRRIGLLSQNIKLDNGDWIATIITLSVLNPDIKQSIESSSSEAIRQYHAEFTRPIIYTRPEEYMFSTTSDNHALVSQPAACKSVVWALTQDDTVQQIQALVLAQFPSEFEPDDDDVDLTPSDRIVAYDGFSMDTGPHVPRQETEAEGMNDTSASVEVKPKGKVLTIDLTDWIPVSETAADIDLDDVLGKVALGMESGKVLILEFV